MGSMPVSVLARDKHGNPVSDLKPEDFVLKDDGKEEQIKLFLTSDASAASAPAPPLPQYFSQPAIRHFLGCSQHYRRAVRLVEHGVRRPGCR